MTITQVQPLNMPTALELTGSGAPKGSLWTGLLQVLSNPSEWKCAATVALVFFVASLAAAPALTRDQHNYEGALLRLFRLTFEN